MPHIAIRMLYSHIKENMSLMVVMDDLIQRFGEKNFFNLTLSHVQDCTELLYKDNMQHSENDGHQPIDDYLVHVIMVDVYNKTLFNNVETGVFILEALRLIGTEIIENSCRTHRALCGIMDGTEYIPINLAAMNSSFRVNRMKLTPLLSETEVAAILDDVFQSYQEQISDQLKDWRLWNEFRATLRKIAGHPRMLEKFIEDLIKLRGQKCITAADLNCILIRQSSISTHALSEDEEDRLARLCSERIIL